MRVRPILLLTMTLAAQNLAPPPWIRQGGVVNAAGRMPFSSPGGGLAPGTLVTIDGLRFAPGKVSVELEAGGRVYEAGILQVSGERILARLPLFSYSGPGRVFVKAGGRRSTGADVVLAPAAFGIFTVNGQGWGSAASVESPAAAPVPLPAFRPGERASLFGTGLGRFEPSAIEIFVGDQRATGVRRTGREGVEQLSFEIPKGVQQGCAVPVLVRTGSRTSNSATLSVGEGACGQTPGWYEQLRSPGRRTGVMVLLHSDAILELTPGKPVHFSVDNLLAGFHARPKGQQGGLPDVLPPAGDCQTWAGPVDANHLALPTLLGPSPDGGDAGLDLGPDVADRTSGTEDLDAGPSLRVTGPEGTRKVLRGKKSPHLYSAILGGDPPVTRIPPTPLFLAPGAYQIELPGGAGLEGAIAALTVPPPVIWNNRDEVAIVDHRSGVELNWKLPIGYTALVVVWNIDRRNGFGGIALCLPPLGATRFRVPATAVANLPTTVMSGSDLSLGFAAVAAVPIDPAPFTAKGLDYSRAIAVSLSGRTVVIR